MLTLSSLLTLDIIYVSADTSLSEAIVLMDKNMISSVIVERHNQVVGILTERDLVKMIAPGAEPGSIPLEQVMSTNILTMGKDAALDEALLAIEHSGVRHILVTGDRGGNGVLTTQSGYLVLGIVTFTDVVRKLEQEFYRMPRTVLDSMSTVVQTVDTQVSLFDVVQRMRLSSVDCVLVKERDKPVGILTERDVVRLLRQEWPLQTPISQVMTKSPKSISGEASLWDASRLMAENDIRRLLVVDNQDKVIGIITNADVVRALRDSLRNVMEGEIIRSRRVLSMIGEGAAEIDGLTLQVLWINAPGAEMLGATPDQIAGQNFTSFFHQDDREKFCFDILKGTQIKGLELFVVNHDHVGRHLLLSCSPCCAHLGTNRIRVVFRDITELAETRKRLQEEKEELRTIYESAREAILIYDKSYGIRRYNRRFIELTGLTDKEGNLSIQDWLVTVDLKDESGCRCVEAQNPFFLALQGKKVRDMVLNFVSRINGEEKWVVVNAIPVLFNEEPFQGFVVASIYDITPVKQKEIQASESENKFRTLFDNMNDPILLLSPEGFIRDINNAARRWFDNKSVVGMHVRNAGFELLDADGFEVPHDRLTYQWAAETKQPFSGNTMGIRIGGKVYWGLVRQTPMLNDKGKVEAIIASFTDLTEYVNARREEEALLDCARDLTRASSEEEIYFILEHYLKRLKPNLIDAFVVHPINLKGDQSSPSVRRIHPDYEFRQDFKLDNCKVFTSGVPIIVKNATIEYGCPYRIINGNHGSYYCTNITVRGEIIAVLHVFSRETDVFDERTVRVVEGLLALAAPTLANMRIIEHNRYLSLIDSLTGLHNRRFLSLALEKFLAKARQDKQPLCVVMADIDWFKTINDTYGHEAGDNILRDVAAVLKSSLRGEDLAIRFGGEEFTIILFGVEAEQGASVANRIRQRIEGKKILLPDGTNIPITLSFGVACCPESGETGEELIQRADQALYEAKKNGRNRVEIAG